VEHGARAVPPGGGGKCLVGVLVVLGGGRFHPPGCGAHLSRRILPAASVPAGQATRQPRASPQQATGQQRARREPDTQTPEHWRLEVHSRVRARFCLCRSREPRGYQGGVICFLDFDRFVWWCVSLPPLFSPTPRWSGTTPSARLLTANRVP
jgi:hypothetical protein